VDDGLDRGARAEGAAAADRHGDALAPGGDRLCGCDRTDPVRDGAPAVEVGARQDDQELLPTPPPDDVAGARSSLRSRSVKVLSTSSPAVGTEGPVDQVPSLALRRRSDVIRVDPLQPGDLVDEQPERLARRVDHDDVPVLRAQGRDYGQRRLPRNQGIGTSAWRLGLVPWWAPRTGEHFGDQVCDLCECVRPEAAGG